MSVVIVGGNERMECKYKDICKKITLDKSISVEAIEDEEGYKDVFEIHDADI